MIPINAVVGFNINILYQTMSNYNGFAGSYIANNRSIED